MRFAFSAVAAVSGLFLLGLAFYGQPAVYIQQAREQWDQIVAAPAANDGFATNDKLAETGGAAAGSTAIDRPVTTAIPAIPLASPSAAQPVDPNADAERQRMAQLQRQVERLKDELTAKQAPQPQPAQPGPQVSRPQPAAPAPAATKPVAAQPAAPPSVSKTAAIPQPATRPATLQTAANTPAVALPEAGPPASIPPAVNAPQQPAPAMAVPQRHEAVKQPPPQPLPETPRAVRAEAPRPSKSRAEVVRQNAAKLNAASLEGPKSEPATRPAERLAIAKPPPLPPLAPQPREGTDDTNSVLARLRQADPVPPRQTDSEPAAVVKPRPALSPSIPRLNAARGALASGRIEDARRLLQTAQLQLVFRPVDANGEEQPNASKGAADVAHALDALSSNEVTLSRRYVEAAVAELSGTTENIPLPQAGRRTTGYAPAYPPR